jgi:hypothetical protein
MIFRTLADSMGKSIALLIIFMGIVAGGSCEKDDICVDGDTPLLIITFYDAEEPDELKDVPILRVVGLGQEFTVNTFNDRTSVDSKGIPLRPDQQSTRFLLIQDSDDTDDVETGNPDTLTFNYETREVFISRACGFVANYENLTDALTSDAENWIQNIEVVRSSVQKQDSAHVKIFH